MLLTRHRKALSSAPPLATASPVLRFHETANTVSAESDAPQARTYRLRLENSFSVRGAASQCGFHKITRAATDLCAPRTHAWSHPLLPPRCSPCQSRWARRRCCCHQLALLDECLGQTSHAAGSRPMHECMRLWAASGYGAAANMGRGGGGSDAGPSIPVKSATTTSSLSAVKSMPFVVDKGNDMKGCGQRQTSICRMLCYMLQRPLIL